MAQTIHHAADGGKAVDVLPEQRVIDAVSMQRGIRKGNAILIEVVAHADLATEGITARVEVYLVVLVVTSLHQYRDVQVSVADGIDDTNLEAKVGQGDDNAINLVAVLAELL